MKIASIILLLGWVTVFSQAPDTEPDLPVNLLPATGRNTLVIYVSGDGGWNKFSESFCQTLKDRGYAVVALNSKKYFWSKKSPEGFAADTQRLIQYYLAAWHKTDCLLVGYSFGADVCAFLPARLAVSVKNKIRAMVLMSPAASTDFVVRLSDLLSNDLPDDGDRKYKVKPELQTVALPTLCVFGDEERLQLKTLPPASLLSVATMPGNHDYNHNFKGVVEKIFSALRID